MHKEFYNLLEKLNLKLRDSENDREEILFSIEKLLKDQLRVNRYNTEIWLRLAMLEYTPPLENFDIIIYYLESILKYNAPNVDALITMTYMYAFVYHFCEIPNDLLKELHLLNCSHNEKASMIELTKAWAYSRRDEEHYKFTRFSHSNYQSLINTVSDNE